VDTSISPSKTWWRVLHFLQFLAIKSPPLCRRQQTWTNHTS
jgi:hypothetical protein